jgi:hypothetical protein
VVDPFSRLKTHKNLPSTGVIQTCMAGGEGKGAWQTSVTVVAMMKTVKRMARGQVPLRPEYGLPAKKLYSN